MQAHRTPPREATKWELDDFHRFVHAAQTSFLGAPGSYLGLGFFGLLVLLFVPLRAFALLAAVTAVLVFMTARAYLYRHAEVHKAVEAVMERNKNLRVFLLALAVVAAALAGIATLTRNVPPGFMQTAFLLALSALVVFGCIVASRQLTQTEYLKVAGRGYGTAARDYSVALIVTIAILFAPGVWLTGAVSDWMHKTDQQEEIAKHQAHVGRLQSELRATQQQLSALEVKMTKPDATPFELRDLIVLSVPPDAGTDAQRAERKNLKARIVDQEAQVKEDQLKVPSGNRDGSIMGTLLWLAVLTPSLFILMLNGWPLAIMRAHWFNVNEHHKIGSTAYRFAPVGNVQNIEFKRSEEEGLRVELAKILVSQGIEPNDQNLDLAFQSGMEALRRDPKDKTPFSNLVEQAALRSGKNPDLAKLAVVNPPPSAIVQWSGLLVMPLVFATWLVSMRIIDAKKRAMERQETVQQYLDAAPKTERIVR